MAKRKRKKSKEELERIRRKAENRPSVRRLRELEARGWKELGGVPTVLEASDEEPADPNDLPRVRLLRELEARGRAELEARRRREEESSSR